MMSSQFKSAEAEVFEPAQAQPLTKADFDQLQKAREDASREASGAKHETVVAHEHDTAPAEIRKTGADEEGQVKRVVVIAVDNSNNSDTAVHWAVDNFLNPETDLALLVNVRPPVMIPGAFGLAYMDAMDYISKADEQARKESHQLLRHYISIVHKSKPKLLVRGIAMRGDARDEICRKVKEVDADALILGSRGQGAFRRMFLGSVSDYCIHHIACPVIIIKQFPTTESEGSEKATTAEAEKSTAQPATKEAPAQAQKDTTPPEQPAEAPKPSA